MPWPHPAVPSPTLALAGWCPLSPTGAQTTQLLVEPPWRPAVLWDQVTLTCQGSGTAGATTWYKDWWRWGPKGPDNFTVTEKGTYRCERPARGLSPPMTVSDDLVLQVPALALLEGDTVTLHCQGWLDMSVTVVSFYCDEKKLWELRDGTELSLSTLQLNDSGGYHCEGLVKSWFSVRSSVLALVTVTVHELSLVPVLGSPPEPTQGSPLTLSCLSTPSPLRPPAPLLHVFYRDGQVVGGPQGSLQLLVPAVGVSHSGNYSCQVRSEGGAVRKSSARLRITVHSECGDGHGEPPQIFHKRNVCDTSPHPSPCPHTPTPPSASPSVCPQPCLCPRSARGQCHHHPQSPVTPGACR
uniref:Uncharacterized protein n=1 Tax=Geospiza parvula TaxID=87175 RepID=A0A8C3MKI3_GEOPR